MCEKEFGEKISLNLLLTLKLRAIIAVDKKIKIYI